MCWRVQNACWVFWESLWQGTGKGYEHLVGECMMLNIGGLWKRLEDVVAVREGGLHTSNVFNDLAITSGGSRGGLF